jgi:hypothetical protein
MTNKFKSINPSVYMQNKMKRESFTPGVAFVSCLFIGWRLGVLFNLFLTGLLLGLGGGFLAMIIFDAFSRYKISGFNQ